MHINYLVCPRGPIAGEYAGSMGSGSGSCPAFPSAVARYLAEGTAAARPISRKLWSDSSEPTRCVRVLALHNLLSVA